jgi:hypothetical protein
VAENAEIGSATWDTLRMTICYRKRSWNGCSLVVPHAVMCRLWERQSVLGPVWGCNARVDSISRCYTAELWSELVGLGNESGIPFVLVRRTSSGSGIPAKKGSPMLKIVHNSSSSGVVTKSMLDEIALEGARAMLAAALEREVQTVSAGVIQQVFG